MADFDVIDWEETLDAEGRDMSRAYEDGLVVENTENTDINIVASGRYLEEHKSDFNGYRIVRDPISFVFLKNKNGILNFFTYSEAASYIQRYRVLWQFPDACVVAIPKYAR